MSALIGAAVCVSAFSVAQDSSPPAEQALPVGPSLTQAQLDQLVAPVALYDDALLADILTASTYPLEVVEAHRWIAVPTNAALTDQGWDPSVQALVPFPEVLQMMDSHLDWTERLGEAFLAQQGDVMDAVQRLRHRAESAGTLRSSAEETVASDGDDVTISPPVSDEIYVPTYDPWCVYGAWPYPVAGPYYFMPWPGSCAPAEYEIAFDDGLFLPFAYWEWGRFDWRHRHIWIDHDRYDHFGSGHVPPGNVWQHDPAHRGGVPYRDTRNAQQFHPQTDYHQSFRGYQGRDGEPAESARPTPPAFGNYGSGREIQTQSERGQMSRGGMSGGAPHGMGGSHGGGGHGGRP